jgi:hypothetical protein
LILSKKQLADRASCGNWAAPIRSRDSIFAIFSYRTETLIEGLIGLLATTITR